ncbi:MAG: hypothetical protein WDZ27_06915 [Waddliaceae bacterium]
MSFVAVLSAKVTGDQIAFDVMQYAIVHPALIHKLILLNTMSPSSEEFSLFVQEWMKRMAPYQDELKAIKNNPEFTKGSLSLIEKYIE